MDPAEDDRVIDLIDNDVDAHTALGNSIAMHEESEFRRFVKVHKKDYSHKEYSKRLNIFRDNLAFVRKWNSEDGHSFKVAMNAMSDLTDDEFKDSYLNSEFNEEYLRSATYRATSTATTKTADVLGESYDDDDDESEGGEYDVRWHKNTGSQPKDVDWSKKGVMSSTNNQAKCFACYAFSACGAIESAVHINNGGPIVKLSAQQIVDCSDDWRNHRCKGGTMVKSYKYIAKKGLMRDNDYGYNTLLNSSPQCKHARSRCKYDRSQTQQGVVGYVNIQSGSSQDIMNAVATRPVSAAIDAHHRPFKLYSSGIFSLASCTTHLTHGLLIVGYGEEDGKKYWVLKNSWGPSWGNNGFGKIARGQNMCSIEDWVNYPIVDQKDSERVSAVRSLAELGDNNEPQENQSDEEDYSQESPRFESNAGFESPFNGGMESPWGAEQLREAKGNVKQLSQ
jgi:C1A family cysteine protease